MKLSDFDYELPRELIAQYPPSKRTASRMLVMKKSTGECDIKPFTEFPEYMQPGDCVVFNDTKVVPARLYGQRKETGGKVEILYLEKVGERKWICFLKPGKRMRPGVEISLGEEEARRDSVIVRERLEGGAFIVESPDQNVDDILEKHGSIPLPPYIERAPDAADRERYQTVYAENPGAVAAPTAGLHFTEEILGKLAEKGVKQEKITLHVGPGTFRPVQTEDVTQHRMHAEKFTLSATAAENINDTIKGGNRVVAVGTTSVRVLESCTEGREKKVIPRQGQTQLFLHPPKQPVIVDALLTNFHLPRSTLLMLVSTFSSTEKILAAYRLAVQQKMRFYSYGDCMLIK